MNLNKHHSAASLTVYESRGRLNEQSSDCEERCTTPNSGTRRVSERTSPRARSCVYRVRFRWFYDFQLHGFTVGRSGIVPALCPDRPDAHKGGGSPIIGESPDGNGRQRNEEAGAEKSGR